MPHPACLPDETGGWQVGGVHQHPGGELEEVAAPIRLEAQDAADAQPGVAQTDRVADLGVEQPKEAGLQPDLTGFRARLDGALGPLEPVANPQPTPQGIGRVRCLDLHQLGALLAHDHAREFLGAGGAQTQRLRLLQ